MESVDLPLTIACAACGQQPACLMELKGHRVAARWFLPHVGLGSALSDAVPGPWSLPSWCFRQTLIKESPRACKLWWLMIGPHPLLGTQGRC